MRKNLPRKILVRAPNWIGDAVMCEPAVRGLRSLFPEAELTMLAKPAIAELFNAHPGVNYVLRYDDKGAHAGMSGKWSLAGTLRRHRFDLAVLFQNAFEAAFLAWLAGIPRRYGYATDGRVLFLTEPVAVAKGPVPVHQVEYYWNLLRPLGLAGGATLPTLLVSTDEDRTVDVRLASVGISSSDIMLGINPGSIYGSAKRWLSDRFAEVAKRLVRRLEQTENAQVAVVILGAKGEEPLGKDIAAQLGGRSAVLSGTTTIRELMAVVKRCRLLITNDTGPMHIAAAFGVPVVAVFGPTDWRTTAPYGQERSIVREAVDCAPCLLRECPIDHRCMTRVSVDRVYEAAVQQIAGSSGVSRLAGTKVQDAERVIQTNQTDQTNMLSGYTIFLDRDGTLNPDPGYIKSTDQFELFPGVPEALARLKRAGARLIAVTNQSGIARGFLTRDDLDAVHTKLQCLLAAAGASLDAIYFCPHHPDDGCDCRKPNRGMIDQAVQERQVNLDRAYVIGDHIRDIELAKRIGARSVLVTTGVVPREEGERLKVSGAAPDWIAASLTEAVDWLLSDVSRLSAPIGARQVTHP
ncbi:MAG: lipopolysaccharide heptosyltransferase II [Nitrospira sp.]|nr:lipopolysaccharide heptosyltransferase II [Nitrospira sp.]